MESENLSDLIGSIYDAALNATLWRGVLGRARALIGGSAAALYSKDASSKRGGIYHDDGGIDSHYKQLYFDKYIKLDPTTTGHFFAELGQPVATADLMDYQEFRETRFFKEWAWPQGLVDSAVAVIDRSLTSIALFGVFRHERNGVADEEMFRRMRLLIPHIRRAVLIGQVIDIETTQAETFADTLNGISAGMFLADETGRIVHANLSGHAMLAAGDVLRAPGGRLVARDAQSDQSLREVLLLAGSGDAAVGTKGISMPLTSQSGPLYVAHILPLTSGARGQVGASHVAVAALFVHQAGIAQPSPPEILAKTFKLTPTELRVLLAIVQVGGVPETAEALGIGEATVKTHLHRLFAKTGSSQRADLVKLVASFANPLIGRTE
jgi:DNA-binding CsgD family transcriptional regulator